MAPTLAEIDEALTAGREDMSGYFTDVCLIERETQGAEKVLNEDTGRMEFPPGSSETVYEGPCRLQVKADINSNVVETTAGDREWTYLTAQLQLPAAGADQLDGYVSGSPDDVDVDNVCRMLAAPFSPSLEDTVFNIAGPYHKSHAVYLRFRIREVVA